VKKEIEERFFGDTQQTDRRLVLFVLAVALAASILLFIFSISREFVSILILALLVAFIQAWRGKVEFAGWFAPFSALIVSLLLVFRNLGIRDTAAFGLPLTIIAASLLNGRKGVLVMTVACLAGVISLGVAESARWVNNSFSSQNTLADYAVVMVVILVTGVLLWAVIGRLNEKNRRLALELAERSRIESARHESEERYRVIVETFPDVILLTNLRGKIQFANNSLEQQTGYTMAEIQLLNQQNRDLIHPDDLDLVRAAIADLLTSDRQYTGTIENRFIAKDGSVLWYSGIISKVQYQGELCLQTVTRNISNQKEAEAALIRSEQRYRLISSVTSDYTFSTRVDPDDSMHLDWVAGAFESITGYTYEDYVAAGGWLALIHPDDLEKDLQAFENLKHNRPVIHEIRTFTKNRELLWVRVGAHPVWDAKLDRLVGIVGAVQNITDRKQAEEDLRQSANRLAIMNEISRAVAELTDLERVLEIIRSQVERVIPTDCFVVTLYNHETRRISYPLIYEKGERLYEEDEELSSDTLSGKVIKSGKSVLILYTQEQMSSEPVLSSLTTGGDEYLIPASLIFVPVIVKGTVIGTISTQSFTHNAYTEEHLDLLEGVANQAAIAIENARLFASVQQELAERKKLIQELEDKNAELERFTYTVSHDLKSPLITISGFLGFIEKDARAGHEDRLKTDILRITEATQKMQRLLNELLELSRIGRQMNPFHEIRFADLVQDALANVRGQLEAGRVAVYVHPDLPTVMGDRPRLTEVLQNLLDNGIKFTLDRPNPTLEIGHYFSEDNKAVFFVRDNGIGIPPEYHNHIFGLFNKLNPKSEGTGIGLAIVKRIIEVHGGRIWLESEVGKGATFYFTLPKPKVE
jgi:PAS domain S-box-containing protein